MIASPASAKQRARPNWILLALTAALAALAAGSFARAEDPAPSPAESICEVDAARSPETIRRAAPPKTERWARPAARPTCPNRPALSAPGSWLDRRLRTHRGDPFGPFAAPLGRHSRWQRKTPRATVLAGLAAQGLRPRFPQWVGMHRRGLSGRPEEKDQPSPFERFDYMTAPVAPGFRALPVWTPQGELWSGVMESAAAGSSSCTCPGDPPGGGGGGGGTVPAGRVPDGISALGTLLTVSKSAQPGDLDLSWGESCETRASDFAIYQGLLGSFYTHDRQTCTTGGAPFATITPPAGGRYFLTVPLSSNAEGDYGVKSDGSLRPRADHPCRSRQASACP